MNHLSKILPAVFLVVAAAGLHAHPFSFDSQISYYIVTATTPTGDLDSDPLRVGQELVTHYTFEGDAADSVGTRHGSFKGPTLPGFVPGFDGGQALSLSGGQYVQLPTGSGNYEDITIAAWVRWNGGGDWQRIFDFGSEIEKYMMLTPSGGGNLRFEMTTSRNNEGTGRLNGPILPIDQWKHVAVTLNGDVGTLYVDGALVDTAVIDQIDPFFGQPYCYIGRSMWNGDPTFNGLIDDFRIYNHALSANEIADVYRGDTFADPLLTGTSIGTTGSGGGNPSTTRDAALDGDLTTYFDSDLATGGWVGLDLGEPHVITRIRYAPRSGYSSRMVGGVFQGSNTADFSSGVVALYTVPAAPVEGVYTAQSISDPNAYRYVRYYGPENGHSNVAVIQFFGYPEGTPSPPAPPRVEIHPTQDGGHEFRITILSVSGLTYQLQRSEDLTPGSWFDIGSAQAGTDNEIEFIETLEGVLDRSFYRIEIQPATP